MTLGLVFDREELSRALSVVARVLPQKSALPFYQALYVGRVDEGHVVMRVTNGDQLLSMRVPARVDGEGGIALPGDEFLRLVRVAPGSQVVVTGGDSRVVVTSGGAEWVVRFLTGITWDDAPMPVTDEPTNWTAVAPEALLDALKKVEYAVSKTQNRPSFQQVMVSAGQAVAADGRRAHVVSGIEVDAGAYLIPEMVLEIVIDMLGLMPEGDSFRLEMSDQGWVRFRSENILFTTGSLAYEFPDVLGKMVASGAEQAGRISVNRLELVSAVRVAASAEDEGAVLLSVVGATMKVESESPQMKAAMDFQVEVEGLNGSWQRWFTAELLTEMLGAFGSERVEFRVDPGGAGVLYVEDERECSVLMPLTR